MIKNHINLHHSQTHSLALLRRNWIKNHINLHHSQTLENLQKQHIRLRTILIYIILKHEVYLKSGSFD